MGFRGEALASIAAVAQVELRTRQEKDELGTCILMEGSRLISQESIACPVGANFAVRNVFFNIPARRKFLKSNQTELSNIMTELERIALANPDRAFSLHQGTTLMVDLPKGNFRQRIVQLFGRKMDALYYRESPLEAAFAQSFRLPTAEERTKAEWLSATEIFEHLKRTSSKALQGITAMRMGKLLRRLGAEKQHRRLGNRYAVVYQ